MINKEANGWRRFYCPVCGHVEWIAPGEDLPEHYRCPLCEAGRSVMLALDDPRLARHKVEFIELSGSVLQVSKRPRFHEEFHHYAYILKHPEGLILYDAPPLPTKEAREEILALGRPRLLVVSHCDFVGFAEDWSDLLEIPIWMGEGEEPLPGNRVAPDERISSPRRIFEDLEVIPVPGHSPGSLAVYWSGAPEGPTLCSGDAVTAWPHKDGKIQLALFQNPPIDPAAEALIAKPVYLLATCMSALKDASAHLERLREAPEKCARPWRGETGGVWIS